MKNLIFVIIGLLIFLSCNQVEPIQSKNLESVEKNNLPEIDFTFYKPVTSRFDSLRSNAYIEAKVDSSNNIYWQFTDKILTKTVVIARLDSIRSELSGNRKGVFDIDLRIDKNVRQRDYKDMEELLRKAGFLGINHINHNYQRLKSKLPPWSGLPKIDLNNPIRKSKYDEIVMMICHETEKGILSTDGTSKFKFYSEIQSCIEEIDEFTGFKIIFIRSIGDKYYLNNDELSLDSFLEKLELFYSDLEKSKKTITVLNSDGDGTFDSYLKIYTTIRKAYRYSRNSLAFKKFGKQYDELLIGDRKLITQEIPVVISQNN